MDLKNREKELKRDVPAVFMALTYKPPKGEKGIPWYVKTLAALTVAYALSPVDLIPDFIPVLGYVDDVIILPSLIALVIKLIPLKVMNICRKHADTMWMEGKHKRWYYALPIVTIWAVMALLILRVVL